MKYEILKYGSPVLRQRAAPITDVTAEIRRLAENMLETMYANSGVGLAAEQVGRTHCICVIDVSLPAEAEGNEVTYSDQPVEMPLVMINPEIVERTGHWTQEEGCLSFPGIYAPVHRADEVTVRFEDLKGAKRVLKVRGLLARAV